MTPPRPVDEPPTAARCPYCHATVDIAREAWIACGSCLARHHRPCWDERAPRGGCSACASTVALGVARREVQPRSRLLLVGAVLVPPALCLAVVGFRATRRAPPPVPTPMAPTLAPLPPPPPSPARSQPCDEVSLQVEWTTRIPATVIEEVSLLSGGRTAIAACRSGTWSFGPSEAPDWPPLRLLPAGVRTFDVETGCETGIWNLPENPVALAFAQKPSVFLSDRSIWAIDGNEVRERARIRTGRSRCLQIVLSEDGRRALDLAVKTDDEYHFELTLWDLETGKAIRSLPEHHNTRTTSLCSVAFVGSRMALSAGWGTVKLWDLDTGRRILSIGGLAPESKVAVSRGGDLAAGGGADGQLKVWRLPSGEEAASLPGLGERLHVAAFSPDARHVVTGDPAGVAMVWDLARGRAVGRGRFPGCSSIAFVNDRTFLAARPGLSRISFRTR